MKFYSKKAPCFYEMKNGSVETIWSKEGTRMGCAWGSFGFAVSLQDAYDEVKEKLGKESFNKALTDDHVTFIKARNSDELIAKIKEVNSTLISGGKRLGIDFETDKSQILWPKGWKIPTVEIEGITICHGEAKQTERQGIVVAGAAMGSEEFVKSALVKRRPRSLKR